MNSKRETGDKGEDIAERHLLDAHYRILDRNFRMPEGELDIVALAPDGKTICFVEVKTRSNEIFAPIESAFTEDKRNRMKILASMYLRTKRMKVPEIRFDFAAVILHDNAEPELRYYENAFTLTR